MSAWLKQYKGALEVATILLWCTLVVAVGIWQYREGESAADQRWSAKWEAQKAELAQAQAAGEHQQRQEEQRRQGAIDEVGENARNQNAAVAADVAGADGAGQRLRAAADQQASRAGAACSDPGIARRGEAATRAAGVLSDLLKRADERSGILAAAYDRARVAGLACEAAYDRVRGP